MNKPKVTGALTLITISLLLMLLACQLTHALEGISPLPLTPRTPFYEVRTGANPVFGRQNSTRTI